MYIYSLFFCLFKNATAVYLYSSKNVYLIVIPLELDIHLFMSLNTEILETDNSWRRRDERFYNELIKIKCYYNKSRLDTHDGKFRI